MFDCAAIVSNVESSLHKFQSQPPNLQSLELISHGHRSAKGHCVTVAHNFQSQNPPCSPPPSTPTCSCTPPSKSESALRAHRWSALRAGGLTRTAVCATSTRAWPRNATLFSRTASLLSWPPPCARFVLESERSRLLLLFYLQGKAIAFLPQRMQSIRYS